MESVIAWRAILRVSERQESTGCPENEYQPKRYARTRADIRQATEGKFGPFRDNQSYGATRPNGLDLTTPNRLH